MRSYPDLVAMIMIVFGSIGIAILVASLVYLVLKTFGVATDTKPPPSN